MERILFAFLLAACMPSVFAASNTDLTVSGAIVPSACMPSLTNGGVIDHGKMTSRDLQPNMPTLLAPEELRLEVLCEGETFFTLTTVDNRAGTEIINASNHGLGLTPNDEKIGSVALTLFDPVADANPVNVIVSRDGGISWQLSPYLGHAAQTSFARPGVNAPVALKHLSARMRAFSLIAPATELTLLDEIPVDGHATLQLKYL
ncbi:DUF1120 domain-containing protein [Pseudomonas trivialis]|uniref:DUF1120 domain-containing protein n=1 Tax=Pseudomonas trivialis TaxID=200450 RepID=UPI0030D4C6E4